MKTFTEIVDSAIAALSSRQQNGYAGSVLRGFQIWSGADLKGKAARYGASYARQRGMAARVLKASGGCIVACEHGFLRTAIARGMDDYGNAVMETRCGIAVINRSGKQFHHI